MKNAKKTANIPLQIERKVTKNELPIVYLIFFHYRRKWEKVEKEQIS